MTVQEYLSQAYKLDQRINTHIEELRELREMTVGLSSPSLGDKVQSSPEGNASFVKRIERLIRMEAKINAEIDLLVELKEQIQSVILEVGNPEEYMILRYRYLEGLSWEKIGRKMCMADSTVYRRHKNAIQHVQLPENPIFLANGSKLRVKE